MAQKKNIYFETVFGNQNKTSGGAVSLYIRKDRSTKQLYLESPKLNLSIAISEDEAEYIYARNGTDLFEANILLRGLHLPQKPNKQNSKLKQQQQKLRSILPNGRNVFIDTSCIYNASECLKSTKPSVTGLLDMATIAFGAIFFDNIITQSHPNLKRGNLPDYVKFLSDNKYSNIAENMESVYAQGLRSQQARNRASHFADLWASFLRLDKSEPPPKINLSQHQASMNSEHLSGYLYDDLLSWNRSELLLAESMLRDRWLSAQTERAIANDYLAAWLGVPYLPAAMRTPIYAELVREKEKFIRTAESVLHLISPNTVLEHKSDQVFIASLPFLLDMILRETQPATHFWHTLKKLRRESEAVRSELREAQADAGKPNTENIIKRYSRELKNSLECRDQRAEIVIAPTMPSDAISIALGCVGLKSLIRNVSTEIHREINRLVRPDLYFLEDIAMKAKFIADCEDRICYCWPQGLDDADLQLLQRISCSNSLSYLNLSQIP